MAIESSCDETACAIVKGGREVIANVVASQIKIHEEFGGVIPEIAAREHLEAINVVIDETFKQAGVTGKDVTAFASTVGPGLVGCLLVGMNAAKTLALAYDKPFIGVNHLNAHLAANFIDTNLEPPFIALLVSGGHTQIIKVSSFSEMEIIGETIDDAVGEAFDKIARVIGLGYPGGPKMDKLAQEGKSNIDLPKVHVEGLDFSFSGLKTAIINLHHKTPDINKADLAASFEKDVAEILLENTKKAVNETNINKIALAGGVSANSYIRKAFKELEEKENIEIYYPELKLCTDNAAMIASAGYYNYLKGNFSDLKLNAVPNLKL